MIKFKDKDQLKSILEKNGDEIFYISDTYLDTELCMVAINQNPFSMFKIHSKHKTEQMCLKSILKIQQEFEEGFIGLINMNLDVHNEHFFGPFKQESFVKSAHYFISKNELARKVEKL